MVRSAVAARYAQTDDLLAADVGKRIKKARLERGLTLAQVGADDLSRSFLSTVETGRSRISLRALTIVAGRLEMPLSYFLSDSLDTSRITADLTVVQAEAELERGNYGRVTSLLGTLPESESKRARTCILRGRAYFRQNEFREAATVLREGLPDLENETDMHLRAEYEYALGSALYSARNEDEAYLHLKRALEFVQAGGDDPTLEGRIVVAIGHIHYVAGRLDHAAAQYERAMDLFGKVRDFATLGSVYSGLSSLYQQRGDLETALAYAKRSVATFRACNHLRNLANEVNNVAARTEELGRLDDALVYGQDAVERAREAGAPDLEAAAHSTVASIYLKRGQIEEAEAEATVAESLAPQEAIRARADTWTILAGIAEGRGEIERADGLYTRALDALRDSPRRGMYAETALAYGEFLRRQGQIDRAFDLAMEAARIQITQNG